MPDLVPGRGVCRGYQCQIPYHGIYREACTSSSRPCPHDTCFGVIYRSLCFLVPQPFGLSGFPIESTMGMKRKLHVDATPAEQFACLREIPGLSH